MPVFPRGQRSHGVPCSWPSGVCPLLCGQPAITASGPRLEGEPEPCRKSRLCHLPASGVSGDCSVSLTGLHLGHAPVMTLAGSPSSSPPGLDLLRLAFDHPCVCSEPSMPLTLGKCPGSIWMNEQMTDQGWRDFILKPACLTALEKAASLSNPEEHLR